MWILSFLPDSFLIYIINMMLFLGVIGIVIGFFGSKIPFISSYSTIIKYLSIAIFCIGLYWKGGYSVEQEWRERVAELEEKVKVSEEKSKEINVVVETKYRDRVKKVVEHREVIVQKIKEVEKVIDAKCELDPSVIKILNEAAKKP